MAEIGSIQITVTTAGEAGAAVGSASSAPIYGELLDVKIDYSASAPNTTDLTITSGDYTILSRANSATDGLFRPMVQGQDSSGSNIAGAYGRIWLSGIVTVALAECDAIAAAVVVTLRVRADHSLSVG
jgi:hypothetical protein